LGGSLGHHSLVCSSLAFPAAEQYVSSSLRY
ncbi:BCCT transporter family protein, partial [Vibrio parahaemolyticus V-223/04]